MQPKEILLMLTDQWADWEAAYATASLNTYFGYAVKIDGDHFKDNINKFDWGIGLGGGIEVWKLQLGARYSWGLQDVAVKDFKIRNNTFTISLAYLF